MWNRILTSVIILTLFATEDWLPSGSQQRVNTSDIGRHFFVYQGAQSPTQLQQVVAANMCEILALYRWKKDSK